MEETGEAEPTSTSSKETEGKGFTKRQWILFLCFGFINLISAMTTSIQAPFYPAEAESKGATATEYGMVFGIFEFIIFITAPIFGQFVSKIGPKTVLNVSLILNALAVIFFGLLDKVDDHTWFITLSFLCRILEALGLSGVVTSVFVIVACEFTSVATVFAGLETFIGVGLIVGPTVGGILFSFGGFGFPFYVVGGLLLVSGFFTVLILQNMEKTDGNFGGGLEGYGIMTILRIPSVFIAAISVVSTSLSFAFTAALLEPHIRRFGLTPFQTGMVFIINGGVYAILAPLSGYVCDKVKKPEYVMLLGNLLICISYVVIGPASFIPLETNLWIVIAGLVIQGLGFAGCFVSTFIVSLRQCLEHGLPDNVAVYGAVSGMWQSMLSLGAWVGPSGGGALYDAVGFRQASWLVIGCSFVAGISIVIHAWIQTPSGESQPLVSGLAEQSENKSKERTSSQAGSSVYGST